jgi:excisionase family DNA binding protein
MEMAKSAQQQSDKRVRSNLPLARKTAAGDSLCLTVTVEDAARILGISRGAAYTHARDGSLPTIRLGKRLLVPRAALDKMLMSA